MPITVSPEELSALIAIEPRFEKLVRHFGLPVRDHTPDLYLALISSIISQQISTKAADTIKQRLLDLVGQVTPERLADLTREQIQGLGLSFRKVDYIQAITAEVLSGSLALDDLSSMSDEQVIKRLDALPGIGPWSAEMLLIFSLGRSDVLSLADLGIQRGIQRFYQLDSLDKKNLSVYRDRFSPYGTAAGLIFWQLAGLTEAELTDLYQSW